MKVKRSMVWGSAVLLSGLVSSVFGEQLLVCDFDSAEKPSENVYNFGAWNKDPNDTTQGCVESFENVEKFGDNGMSLRLDYDVDSPAPAYNGFWIKVKDLDLSKYQYFNFYIKGDSEKGSTRVIKLEIKNSNEVGRFLYSGVTNEWSLAKIALSDFRGLRDWTDVTELVLVFDDMNSKPKMGTLYVDNVFFSTE